MTSHQRLISSRALTSIISLEMPFISSMESDPSSAVWMGVMR